MKQSVICTQFQNDSCVEVRENQDSERCYLYFRIDSLVRGSSLPRSWRLGNKAR